MPRTTRIVGRRRRRQQQSGRLRAAVARVVVGVLFPLAFFLSVLFFGSVATAAAVYESLARDLPSYDEIQREATGTEDSFEATKIYAWGPDEDDDGEKEPVLIYEVAAPLGGERQWLSLEQMPADIVAATLALEDPSFRGDQQPGIGETTRALIRYVRHGTAGPGRSSLARQLVQRRFFSAEAATAEGEEGWTPRRRQIEEFLLTERLRRFYTKEQILEWYLNTSFYGNLAFGIEAAAHIYFDKDPAELTLAEAAQLAALPQTPELNPLDNPQAAHERQLFVLEAMVREGAIDQEQLVNARSTPLTISSGAQERFDMIAPHFALYVQRQMEERYGPEALLRDGLRVYTTLDLEMQRQAECLARAHIARLSGAAGSGLPADEQATCPALTSLPSLDNGEVTLAPEGARVNNASVVVLDPASGEIRVMVGSLDYWNEAIDGSFNVATEGLRQPGSAFNAFTYLTALSQGYNAATMVLDVKTDFGALHGGASYTPQNYDGDYHGPMPLRQALANNYNVPATEVLSWVGVANAVRTARSMGISTIDGTEQDLSLPLGGGDARLLEMVHAFAVLDNLGTMVGRPAPEEQQQKDEPALEPSAIVRVEDRAGNVLYEYAKQQQEIVSPQLAWLMNDMLSDRRARCPAFDCPNFLELPENRPAAVTTGTTNDFRDAWAIGYTPQLVTGVWVGNTDHTPTNELSGYQAAAPIWHGFMAWALADEPASIWPRPAGIVEESVCAISGLLPTPHCPPVSEFFIVGTQPAVQDTVYQEFQINRETGRLATLQTPPELIDSRIYQIYPERAADWAAENALPQPPTEYDTITGAPNSAGATAIRSPQPFDTVSGKVEILATIELEDFSHYRLAFFEGLTPDDIMVISDSVLEERSGAVVGVWDVGELDGLYTLLLTVVRTDGTFEEASVAVTVDNR
ncbi:MAG: transglycosylase domain-containing protein [Candidatus Promineifilaceae bacterium]|nr:transglycosylase domain-containing protein [Candidatus Promineifilaceae bacterium]